MAVGSRIGHKDSIVPMQHLCFSTDVVAVSGECEDEAVRLVGSDSKYEGIVELCYMGRWGFICDDEWDHNDMTVVCTQLEHDSLPLQGEQLNKVCGSTVAVKFRNAIFHCVILFSYPQVVRNSTLSV